MVRKSKTAAPVTQVVPAKTATNGLVGTGSKRNVLDQLKQLDADRVKLDENRAQLVAGAKEELLARGKEVVEGLATLGYAYKLTAVAPVTEKASKSKGKGSVRHSPQGVCPICQFASEPAHDGRAHRGQKTNKQPFTEAELERLNLKRI